MELRKRTIFFGHMNCGDIPKPYIGLIHGRYLQFRFLKWPLISWDYSGKYRKMWENMWMDFIQLTIMITVMLMIHNGDIRGDDP